MEITSLTMENHEKIMKMRFWISVGTLSMAFLLLQGVRAELLAQRMGYDRKLTAGMIQALQDRLQEEIDKRAKKPTSWCKLPPLMSAHPGVLQE